MLPRLYYLKLLFLQEANTVGEGRRYFQEGMIHRIDLHR